MKKLTDDGVIENNKEKGADEVIDVDLPRKVFKNNEQTPIESVQENRTPEPKMLPRREAQNKVVKTLNNGKVNQMYGLRTMKKSTYIAIWVAFGLVFLLALVAIIWGNINFKNKDFTPQVILNNENNIPAPNITNQYTHNIPIDNRNNVTINIDVGDEIAGIIADRVIEIINNETS